MKKGLIVTLYDDLNYGNKLQNYAVYKLLSDRGIEVVNLKNNRKLNYKNTPFFVAYTKFVMSKTKWFLKKRFLFGLKYYGKRRQNFKLFSSQIKTTDRYFSYRKIDEYDKYDYLFVGSDQVWNPNIALDDLSLFAGFKKGKKISVSASFGVSTISESARKAISEPIKDFYSISVREESGKKIIDSINSKKRSILLVDPTMAINKAVWEEQAKRPKCMTTNKYILLAFLGTIDEKLLGQIDRFANRHDYEIIDIYKKNSKWTQCGPSEFLYLEKNASLICTDSFHSSVFGIIFNTPILVTGRNGVKESMNSRIDTLLKTFGLEGCRYDGAVGDDILNVDFKTANERIKKESKKYSVFLDEVIGKEVL